MYDCFSALIDLQGLEPIKSLLRELGGWPVVMGNEWKEEDVDLIDLIVKLRLYNNKILIDQWVSADDKNSKVNIIQVNELSYSVVFGQDLSLSLILPSSFFFYFLSVLSDNEWIKK